MQFFHAAWPEKYRDGVEKVVEDKGQVPDCHASKANATCSPVGLVSVPSSLHAIPSHLISSHPIPVCSILQSDLWLLYLKA